MVMAGADVRGMMRIFDTSLVLLRWFSGSSKKLCD